MIYASAPAPGAIVLGEGFMGSAIAARLEAAGATVCVADAKPRGPLTSRLDINDTAAITALLSNARRGARPGLVIDTIGPFATRRDAAMDAALQTGFDYVDLAAEQVHVRHTHLYKDSLARKLGRRVVPGFGFEHALSDWGAAAMLAALRSRGISELASLEVAYAFDGLALSEGGQRAVFAAAIAPSWRWHQGHWDRDRIGEATRQILFPSAMGGLRYAHSFPSPECFSIPRHVPTGQLRCFVSVARSPGVARILATAGRGSGLLTRFPVLTNLVTSFGPSPTTRAEAAATRFCVKLLAVADGQKYQLVLGGQDLYDTSAQILTVAWLARKPAPTADDSGVISPSEWCDARAALGTLVARRAITMASDIPGLGTAIADNA